MRALKLAGIIVMFLYLGVALTGCGIGSSKGDVARKFADEALSSLARAFESGVDELNTVVDMDNFMRDNTGWGPIMVYLETSFYPALQSTGYSLEAHEVGDYAEISDDENELLVKTFEYYFITDGIKKRFYGEWMRSDLYHFAIPLGYIPIMYASDDEKDGKLLWRGNELDFNGDIGIEYYVIIPFDKESLQADYSGLSIWTIDYGGAQYYYSRIFLNGQIENALAKVFGKDSFHFIVASEEGWIDEGEQITLSLEGKAVLIPVGETVDSTWLKLTDLSDSSGVFWKKLITPRKIEDITGVNPFNIVPYLELDVSNGYIHGFYVEFKKLQDGKVFDPDPQDIIYDRLKIYCKLNDGTEDSSNFLYYFRDESGWDPDFSYAFKGKTFHWSLDEPVPLSGLSNIKVDCYVGNVCMRFIFMTF